MKTPRAGAAIEAGNPAAGDGKGLTERAVRRLTTKSTPRGRPAPSSQTRRDDRDHDQAADREIERLMALHPKGYDLSLDRIRRCSKSSAIRRTGCRR
jgi:hypothetical protein